jgi:hypothetical protein
MKATIMKGIIIEMITTTQKQQILHKKEITKTQTEEEIKETL